MKVNVELTTPACPLKETIKRDVENALTKIGASHVELELTANTRGPLQPRKDVLPQVRAKGGAAANALQIGVNRYLDLDEPGRLVNHSCDPNAAIREELLLVAIRDIQIGEEIRFDYSTTISDGWTRA